MTLAMVASSLKAGIAATIFNSIPSCLSERATETFKLDSGFTFCGYQTNYDQW
jgi:hypothetical protein